MKGNNENFDGNLHRNNGELFLNLMFLAVLWWELTTRLVVCCTEFISIKNILFVPYNNMIGNIENLVFLCTDTIASNDIFGCSLHRYSGDYWLIYFIYLIICRKLKEFWFVRCSDIMGKNKIFLFLTEIRWEKLKISVVPNIDMIELITLWLFLKLMWWVIKKYLLFTEHK